MDTAWKILSQEPRAPEGVLTDEFVRKFDRELDFKELSKRYYFTIEMLRTYFHRVDWCPILRRQELPEYFLREMAPQFDDCSWEILSKYQLHLSESFIREFRDKVDWELIIQHQNVSKAFLDEHYNYYTAEEDRVVSSTASWSV